MSKTKQPVKKPNVRTKSAGKSAARLPAKIPQAHGGALLTGGMPGNPGGGRPPDAIRAQLRELGAVKGAAFLSDVLDGRITYTLTGKCSECGAESKPTDHDWLKTLTEQIRASVDQRLKANEQALKYGLGTKDEVSVTNNPQFIAAVQVVRDELEHEFGAERVDAAILRAQARLNG